VTGRYTEADEAAIQAELRSVEPLGPDLRDHLLRELTSLPFPARRHARWVMNAEWWDEVNAMARAMGEMPPPWPRMLLGKPVDVREDGGVPHLETP